MNIVEWDVCWCILWKYIKIKQRNRTVSGGCAGGKRIQSKLRDYVQTVSNYSPQCYWQFPLKLNSSRLFGLIINQRPDSGALYVGMTLAVNTYRKLSRMSKIFSDNGWQWIWNCSIEFFFCNFIVHATFSFFFWLIHPMNGFIHPMNGLILAMSKLWIVDQISLFSKKKNPSWMISSGFRMENVAK